MIIYDGILDFLTSYYAIIAYVVIILVVAVSLSITLLRLDVSKRKNGYLFIENQLSNTSRSSGPIVVQAGPTALGDPKIDPKKAVNKKKQEVVGRFPSLTERDQEHPVFEAITSTSGLTRKSLM